MIIVQQIRPDLYVDFLQNGLLRESYPPFPEAYETVAIVKTDSREGAYQQTQHLDRPWWTNSKIVAATCFAPRGGGKRPGEARSTSVGDVLVCLGKGMHKGEVHRIHNLGFERIEGFWTLALVNLVEGEEGAHPGLELDEHGLVSLEPLKGSS